MGRAWLTIVAASGCLTAGAQGAPAAQSCDFRLVDASPTGAPGNGNTLSLQLSGDGRFVVFESTSTNLVAGDVNGLRDVFVHDLALGATELASVSSSGVQADGDSIVLAASGDGRFIVFLSWASNLDASDTDGKGDIYLRDRQLGLTEWISVPLTPVPSVFDSGFQAAVSDDGRYVAFSSNDANLIPNDTNGWADVFVRDRVQQTTLLVSQNSQGVQADRGSVNPDISADGSRISFLSQATNLDPSGTKWPIPQFHLYVHELASGVTQAIDLDASGELPEQGVLDGYDMSPDGGAITFWGSWTLTPELPFGGFILWRAGVPGFQTMEFADGQPGWGQESPELSWDGRYVTFGTNHPSWKVNPFDSYGDVVLHDTALGVTGVVSSLSAAQPLVDEASRPEVSYDGSVIAFLTDSPLLTGYSINDHQLAVVRTCDPKPGLTFCFPTRSPTGCVPSLIASGSSSASLGSGHVLLVNDVRNDELGLFFYGTSGDAAAPVWNGWMCLSGPVRRMPVQFSAGSVPPTVDCSGGLATDFNAWIASGVDPALVPGTPVYVQSWSRDSTHPGGALLSDAAAFSIAP